MSANKYFEKITGLLGRIHQTQAAAIESAADAMAVAIAAGKRVYLFGSGHSVIPVLDIFPRYGSFVGFVPLYDPRLMWTNVIGPGGARELLWIERREGYAEVFLSSYPLEAGDVMIVFSHGGANAAPIDVAKCAADNDLTVITVSSHANVAAVTPTHSSGKMLSGFATIAIDNCVEPEDSQVDVGTPEKVAAGSTMAAVFIAMSLVAETGAKLAARGFQLTTFVSPNVPGVEKDHNEKVFQAYARMLNLQAWKE